MIGKSRQLLCAYQHDASARALIFMLLSVNFLLISLHTIHELIAYFKPGTFHYSDVLLTSDGGYPELFNYLQLTLLVWLMLEIFVRSRGPIYAFLGAGFLFALIDDTLLLHERVGGYAESIDLPAPATLGAMHFGELLYFLVVAVLFIVLSIYGLMSSRPEDRKIGMIFVFWMVMLGFFAAVIDAIHVVLFGKFFGSNFIFNIVEDGGEMLVVGFTLSTAVLLFRHLDELRRPSRQAVCTALSSSS